MKLFRAWVVRSLSVVVLAMSGAAHAGGVSLDGFPAELRACIDMASDAYRIPAYLIRGIVSVESRWNPYAKAHNPDGSVDIGPMQVNSRWLKHPEVLAAKVSEADLHEPCTNIFVGTWVLANLFRKHGVNWEAVGRYNSATPSRRDRYAWMVYSAIPESLRPPVEGQSKRN